MAASEDRSASAKSSGLSVITSNRSTPVSTTKILENFCRDEAPNQDGINGKQIIQVQDRHHQTVQQLRKWHAQQSGDSPAGPLRQMLSFASSRTPRPSEADVRGCIDNHFPARMEMKVSVCDFGAGRAERREVCLGDIVAGTLAQHVPNNYGGLIRTEFENKPEWSQVRWM